MVPKIDKSKRKLSQSSKIGILMCILYYCFAKHKAKLLQITVFHVVKVGRSEKSKPGV